MRKRFLERTGYSFGYGFVEFINPDDADKAIALLDGLRVQNKRIKVSYARPPGQDIKDTNLYIQNLPRNIEESFLDELFSPFGKIVQRRLLLDKYTQMPRGVGFVRFSRREEAQHAIRELNGHVPEGASQPINVKVAEDYSKSKQMYMLQYMGCMGDYSAGYGDYGAAYSDYGGGYGDYDGYGWYGGGYAVSGAGNAAADGADWEGADPARAAPRGLPRRGGRGFSKAMPYKSNNRFNPMGSGL
ncbi:sex-lethal homolog [Pollicipes pollicipes]|uniref:sex-lethal homolog n=1 Tax=Pollicipes pollicipes TaxID=41117 RepID=UPI001884C2EE|nr:sex-lethal homolog [Pollicipes pollicipes]